MDKVKIKLGGGLSFLAVSLSIGLLTDTWIKLSDWANKEEDKKLMREANEAVKAIDRIVSKIDSIKNAESKEEEAQ